VRLLILLKETVIGLGQMRASAHICQVTSLRTGRDKVVLNMEKSIASIFS
jgi:hypothetical protein